MSRGVRGPGSPYRYALMPEGGVPRHVPCSRQITRLLGAKQGAVQWAGDVAAGTITIEQQVSPSEWRTVATATVRNGEVGRWS